MSRLLIVSNRLPVSVTKRKSSIDFQKSVGGLATGLGSFYKSYDSYWIGWSGVTEEKTSDEEKREINLKLKDENCYQVSLSRHQLDNYYYGFSNKTIWPLFHYFTLYAVYKKSFWKSYKKVNEAFCNEVVKIAKPGDTIWIHDYHLMLLPKMIRDKMPNASIGFFLHIPFPSFEVFRLFPWRREILEGLLGADLVGFHTYGYVRHFFSSVRRILGYDHHFGQMTVGNRLVKADAFPMGIDYERFSSVAELPEVKKKTAKIHKKLGNRKIILSVDRLDYTKGILQRLEAFDALLERNPKYRKKVTLILVAVPSRTRVEQYVMLKKRIDERVGSINGKYGSMDWVPVWYLCRSLPFKTLTAFYRTADVALVTPVRDGMNLIAKEFIATKTDGTGVLILSEMAGAAKELVEAIIVNPNNEEDVVKALKTALKMPEKEQKQYNGRMQKRLQSYDVRKWARDFMDGLSNIKKIQHENDAKIMTVQSRKRLLSDYSKSKKRLIMLDYDGTLVPFADKPEKAKPDARLTDILTRLSKDLKNEVVIISGRDWKTLDSWFGKLNLSFIAEHGVWIKEHGKGREMLQSMKSEWKEELRPLIELYRDKTPGSILEEKDFSLVWHYRNVEPELASVRSRELKSALLDLTANHRLGVLEGNKVLEVKSLGITKGTAALKWLLSENWDFVLAMGDDRTDEDLFDSLPETAYSLKVGVGPSKARFSVKSVKDVRSLLQELTG